MESGVSKNCLRAILAFVAGAAALSCGAGVHDGRGEVFATQTIDQAGGQIVLREATLDVWQDCLLGPSAITLRRYDSIDHSGAVGPVFEVQVPAPDAFINDPRIGIEASPVVAGSASSVIGFLIPGVANEQWVSDSDPAAPCTASVVCGPVHGQIFNGASLKTTVLLFAIVSQCITIADCPSQQTCNSGACQKCPVGSPCN